jgi:hypothetical protein
MRRASAQKIPGELEMPTEPQMLASYYVYYRIADGEEPLARECAQRLLDQIAKSTGVRGRLMVKRGEPNLWMEIFEDVPDAEAFERALATCVDELELERLLAEGSRRLLECFECV